MEFKFWHKVAWWFFLGALGLWLFRRWQEHSNLLDGAADGITAQVTRLFGTPTRGAPGTAGTSLGGAADEAGGGCGCPS